MHGRAEFYYVFSKDFALSYTTCTFSVSDRPSFLDFFPVYTNKEMIIIFVVLTV